METNKNNIRILVADDEADLRSMLDDSLSSEGFIVTTVEDGAGAINKLREEMFDIALLDVRMPRVDGIEVLTFIRQQSIDTQVIMVTAVNDVRIAVECMKLGAFHFLTKPYLFDELVSLISLALEKRSLLIENKIMKSEISRLAQPTAMVGTSKEFTTVREIAAKVAPSDSIVLIQGASGTGKELFASFIHKHSSRADKPFVVLNCASIPDTLIESELFGHEKGAFTDAIAMRQGLVEIANGGTLFLDEIGEVNHVFQPKLLRFIQTGEYRRVGGTKMLRTDVRIISATNKNLKDEVSAGRFREDLWYRLNVITLALPSLQQRKEDIPLLVRNILERKSRQRQKKQLLPEAMDALMNYSWPGNIRELENVLERALVLTHEEYISPNDLAITLTTSGERTLPGVGIGSALTIKDIEREHIAAVLNSVHWDKNLAATILGISLKTLYTKIQQFNLKEKK